MSKKKSFGQEVSQPELGLQARRDNAAVLQTGGVRDCPYGRSETHVSGEHISPQLGNE